MSTPALPSGPSATPTTPRPTTPLGASLRLPELTQEQVEATQQFARRRKSFTTKIGDQDLSIRPFFITDGAVIEGDDRIEITFTLDGKPGVIRLPTSLANRMLETIEPGLSLNALDEESAAWALELAIKDTLEALEEHAGIGVQFMNLSFVARQVSSAGYIGFHCTFGDVGRHRVFLKLDRRDTRLMDDYILSQPYDPIDYGNPKIDLSFQVGATRLTIEEMSSLAAGDTLLLDQTGVAKGYLNIAVGDKWRIVARLNNTGGIVAQTGVTEAGERDDRLGESKETKTMSDNPDENPSDDAPDAHELTDSAPESSVDELPVKLVFELGRIDMELQDLRTVSEGYVFNIGRSLTHPVDIVVSGRRIGAGELVRVGESVGVRISRLFANDGTTG